MDKRGALLILALLIALVALVGFLTKPSATGSFIGPMTAPDTKQFCFSKCFALFDDCLQKANLEHVLCKEKGKSPEVCRKIALDLVTSCNTESRKCRDYCASIAWMPTIIGT